MKKMRSIHMFLMAILMVLSVFTVGAFADPPAKTGNPGVPGLLAEIANLEEQIALLESQDRVPQTGQTTSYTEGDDGDLQMGVTWLIPRFTDNGNGTVTDNLTKLIWLKDANCCFEKKTWLEALDLCNNLASGDCGLTDGSVAGDWRLANVRELLSLVHYGVSAPAVPDTVGRGKWSEGDPFSDVKSDKYWSSTARHETNAWWVSFGSGLSDFTLMNTRYYVWPVRGGE